MALPGREAEKRGQRTAPAPRGTNFPRPRHAWHRTTPHCPLSILCPPIAAALLDTKPRGKNAGGRDISACGRGGQAWPPPCPSDSAAEVAGEGFGLPLLVGEQSKPRPLSLPA